MLSLVLALSSLVFAGSALAAVTRYEQTDPAVVYSGTWTPSTLPGHSGGNLAYTTDVLGSTASFSFNGTGVTWIAAKWYNRGIGEIQIDGGAWQPVDQYAPGIVGDTSTVQYQQAVYSVSGLTNGPHTVLIRLTNTHNLAAASPYLITLDAFDVTVPDPPVVSTTASSPGGIAAVALIGVLGAAVMLRRRAKA